jgi:hypothetical protein
MIKRTVYILGAGFSFKAGLPIMANFLDVAKDIAIDSDDKELKNTLRCINALSSVKNYCESDLFNLEEAFSFFETEDWIKKSNKKHSCMVDLIKKVIKETTPSAKTEDLDFSKENWHKQIYAPRYKSIFCFLSRIFCLKFKKGENGKLIIKTMDFGEQNDIITFNYDTLLEDCLENINKHALENCRIKFNKDVYLYKLHGCVEKKIVPPTWAKYNTDKELREIWKEAFNKIIKANRIVFIGYSMPRSDAYFRSFLKSALSKAENLKEIKVICKDDGGKIEENYKEFSNPARFKFLNKEWESIVPDFDDRSFNNPNPDNPPEKQSWWIKGNDSEYGIFGWETGTCKELYEKEIYID